MRFETVGLDEAVGTVSAHTVRLEDGTLRKGHVLSAPDVERLRAAGVGTVTVARLAPDDVGEDAAAHRLALVLAGAGIAVADPFTGRANLFAARAGVLVVDAGTVDAVNGVDEAITVATLPAFKPVVPGEMIATVKIIPYAVPGSVLERGLASARAPALRIAPYRRVRVAVISTLLPGLKEGTVIKTLAVLQDRLRPAGARIATEIRVRHDEAALAQALRDLPAPDLVVVFGASAIADRRDVIPAAIEGAGGTVEHFGMPVDPGNLLLLGTLGGVPVIGAPGCARSPKENGFDWVLHRLLAGLPVGRPDIVALGVGGLLMEIVSRPQPRSGEGTGPADEA